MLKRTVLVVDDQLINRKILGKILMNDYKILYAVDGEEAIKQLQSQAEIISAVLLDIVMPKMDGYAVLEAMAKDSVLSKIPVIVSSQKDGDEAELKALSLGAQDFIAKPYKADIIRHRLGNTIRLRETAAIINKAEKDELTGLYNKQFFLEKAKEYLLSNTNKEYDLVCLGVERFKLINDTFGVSKGDEVLCYMAKLIQEVSKDVNICGRFTADIFFTLLEHQDHYDNEEFEKWIQKLNEFPIDMDIKIHCGIYQIHDIKVPISTMCDRASLAADKNKGKYDAYYSYYDDTIREKLLEEQFITSTMQSALEQKQFHVYYQPKYDLNTERIAGAEALVRWIHPERGLLSPGVFIPLFESNGFITQLDAYVWERACQDIHQWIEKGNQPVSVSVNVSRADIYNPKLTEIFLGLIEKYQIPMKYLHLEITESAYTDNQNQIIEVVNRLRNLGFIIEMDDFGSGYSSLNMLAEMPVDVLKLDMKFIQNESKKASGKGILSFVISLAKWLNLAVIAEGVETAEQISSLRSMDCNYVQGFYFARPLKKEDFENLLSKSKITEMVCSSRSDVKIQREEKREDKKSEQGRQMLIVDDIEVNRAVLAGTFWDEYTIVEMENGKLAWEYLEENYEKVEIIMLDLLMPVMDGFQLLEKIRQDKKTQKIPVIITSQGDTESEQRALEMKADDFISKPYKPDIVRHRVENVLANYHLKNMSWEAFVEREEINSEKQIKQYVEMLKPYFDSVNIVDLGDLKGNQKKDTKLHEFRKMDSGMEFVISESINCGTQYERIEMVTKLTEKDLNDIDEMKMK